MITDEAVEAAAQRREDGEVVEDALHAYDLKHNWFIRLLEKMKCARQMKGAL